MTSTDMALGASGIVRAIRRKHVGAALLEEVSVSDPNRVDPMAAWGRRIDLLIWRSGQRTAVEVKISRADFRRDTAEKRDVWRRHAHRFIYATPVGLLTPDEVPAGCGLWEVDEFGDVRVVVRAKVNHDALPLPEHAVQGLAYRAMRNQTEGAVTWP